MPVVVLALLFSLTVAPALAQTFPTPHDLSQGEYVFAGWPSASPAGTYPPNMRFHRGGGQDPGLAAQPTADYVLGYSLTAGPRITGLGADGFSFLNTGTGGDLGAAVMAVNTTGQQNVQVSWLGGTVATGGRAYALRLQYRVGDSGAFVDVPGPVEYLSNATAGHSQAFNTALPQAAANQPLVYLRWKYYQISGSGTRPALRVANIRVAGSDSPGSGTGTARFSPDAVRGGRERGFALVVEARSDEPADRLTHIDFLLPDWAANVDERDILLTPAGGTVTVQNRQVRIAGASISQSSPLRIDVEVEVPELTRTFAMDVRTGAGSAQTVALVQQPELLVWGTPEPIANVRVNDANGAATRLGEWVAVQGVITSATQFRTGAGVAGPSYIQDASGGMAVFSPSRVSEAVAVGDEVILVGRVIQFFGLNQLDDQTRIVQRVRSGVQIEPLRVTLGTLLRDGAGGVEEFEGRLVQIDNVTVNTAFWNVEGAGTNYQLNDGTGTLDVRINPGTNLVAQPAPSGQFTLVGVVSQFRNVSPFIGGYQLMPRSRADIIAPGNAPRLTSRAPFETAATPTSVTLAWTTDRPAHSEVRFVRQDSAQAGRVDDSTLRTEHAVTVTDLRPATMYWLELRSASEGDTTVISRYPVSTTSPAGATQAIRVRFNRSVDTRFATGTQAEVADFAQTLIQHINDARVSVDLALYSLSGTAGLNIANALIAADRRGVRVRVIMDDATAETLPPRTLRSNNIPFITDAFGANQGPNALHHNKFGVFDALGSDPARVWVFNGSWNPTDPGTNEHYQNTVWVQDPALANAFTLEFDQLWGSNGPVPNPENARFGARKTLMTPTVFWIGDTYTRLLFSPQGFGSFGTTERQILNALETADHDIDLGLNLITRLPIVDVLRARQTAGVNVRGVVGEVTTTGSVFTQLAAAASQVLEFPSARLGLLHHKYAVVDARHPASNPTVITGSHNWSRSANESNDENTLILHSERIANEFIQEFAARYLEAGGTLTVSASRDASVAGFDLLSVAPNPFRGTATLRYALPVAAEVTLTLYNTLGQEVYRSAPRSEMAGTQELRLEANGLPAGLYLWTLTATQAGTPMRLSGRLVHLP